MYKVEVSFCGGLQMRERTYVLTLDLQAIRGLMYTHERDLDDLVKQVEKLADSSSKTNEKLSEIVRGLREGLWLRNQEFIIRDFDSARDTWSVYAIAKLREFRAFWLSAKGGEVFIPPSQIQTNCKFVAAQVLTIAANSPTTIPKEVTAGLSDISAKLSELGGLTLFIGRESHEKFQATGDGIVELLDALIKLLDLDDHAPLEGSGKRIE